MSQTAPAYTERGASAFNNCPPTSIILTREIPETEFEQLLISIVDAPVAQKVAALIRKRVDRDLEPFDIWYDGFKLRSSLDVEDLDRRVGERYPTPRAFKDDLPFLLRNLGFDAPTSNFLSSKIDVDPSPF